nr:MAG TPA: hypothetical protein [Bacteriophage sp.]
MFWRIFWGLSGAVFRFSCRPPGCPIRAPFSSQASSILNCIYCIYNLLLCFQLFAKQLFCE